MELTGKMTFGVNGDSLRQLCQSLIPSFDENRFDLVAMRVYSGKEKFVTFYFADKLNESSTMAPGRYPVKKFKVQVPTLEAVFKAAAGYNFTVEAPGYFIDDMEVMNK